MHNLETGSFKLYNDASKLTKAAIISVAFSFIDVFWNPIQLMQSRFILQNRLPNFSVYKGIVGFLKKKYRRPRTLFQGALGHFPKNILFSLGYVNFFKDDPDKNFIFTSVLANTLAYPITTCIRRMQCQDADPGMLPIRYGGCWHAFKLILKEEGFRGLYRGFLAFSAVTFSINAGLTIFQGWGESWYELQYS